MGQARAAVAEHRRRGRFRSLDVDLLHVPAVVAQRLEAPAPQLRGDVGRGNPFVAGAAAPAVQRVAGEELQVTLDRRLGDACAGVLLSVERHRRLDDDAATVNAINDFFTTR